MSICKQLNRALGGKWTYVGNSTWMCDDEKRMVCRCSPGVDEFDNPLPGPSPWYIYGDGPSRRAEQYVQRSVSLEALPEAGRLTSPTENT